MWRTVGGGGGMEVEVLEVWLDGLELEAEGVEGRRRRLQRGQLEHAAGLIGLMILISLLDLNLKLKLRMEREWDKVMHLLVLLVHVYVAAHHLFLFALLHHRRRHLLLFYLRLYPNISQSAQLMLIKTLLIFLIPLIIN